MSGTNLSFPEAPAPHLVFGHPSPRLPTHRSRTGNPGDHSPLGICFLPVRHRLVKWLNRAVNVKESSGQAEGMKRE